MAKNDTQLPYGLHKRSTNQNWYCRWGPRDARNTRSTGTTSLKEAIKRAERIIKEASSEVTNIPRPLEMTLDAAFGRYYIECVQKLKSKNEIRSKLHRMAQFFGPDVFISSLTQNDLLQFQNSRRAEGVSNRTINYEVPQTIRTFYKHARKWGVNLGPLGALQSDDWKEFTQLLPPPRIREASNHEMSKILRHLRPDYRPIMVFMLITGFRRMSNIIRRDQIIWDRDRIVYSKKSKHANDEDYFPLLTELRIILRREIERGGKDCEWVFTYVVQNGDEKGKRKPITIAGWTSQLRRAMTKSGVEDFRIFHDWRHTAASRMLRKTRNLAIVQRALGHSSITMTQKYAHVHNEDLLRALGG